MMDIESRPRWIRLIVVGLVIVCLLRMPWVSMSLVDVSIEVVDGPRNFETQSNGVDWWPMFHHDQSHTGYSTSTAPNTNHVRWSYDTDGIIISSSPAVAHGKVYIGSNDELYCLDASTGEFIWSQQISSSESSPAVADGKVYVGSWDDNVYCLDASTGDFIWNYPTGESVYSSPAVVNNRVYVGSDDNNVYCLDALTGVFIWSYPTDWMVRSSPAVADGKVYVGSGDGKVYCLDALTGTHVWSQTIGDYVASSPAVVDGKVYIGSYNGHVYCLDALTGVFIWNRQTGDLVYSSPAVADGKVYVGSFDHNVYCYDASDGGFIWSHRTDGRVWSSPAVADGKVYIGSRDRNVYCLDASAGALVWSYMTDNIVDSSPAVADGRVYIGSYDTGSWDGKVYAFQDIVIADICVGCLDDQLVTNVRVDDLPTIIRTRTFDGTRWRGLPSPIPEPKNAPFSPSITVNPEPVLYEPLLTMATTVNPEPVLYEPNIVIRQYNGTCWTGPTSVPDTTYGNNPTIVSLSSDELFLFWENTNSTPTHTIALSICVDQTNWSTLPYFPGEGEKPTATFYNDEIYLLWEKDDGFAYRVYNPANESWSEERGQTLPFLIDPQPTPYDPLITVHDGLLYLVYESQSVYLHTFNGTAWSIPYALENFGSLSPSKPAIVSFGDQLHIVYTSEGELYYQTLEGDLNTDVWSTPTEIPLHPLSTEWWPMFHHDLNRTGYSGSTAPSTDNILWDYTTGGSVQSSPTVSDSRVYVGSNDDRVYCLDATTGTQIWNYTTGYNAHLSSPTIAGHKVYGSSGLNIYCLDASTGEFIWSYTAASTVYSSPAVADGKVYAGSIDNKVYCLNASTGGFMWSYLTGHNVYSSPAVVDNRVYIGSDDNRIYCLNAANGTHIWNYTTGDIVRSYPSVSDGKVYVGSADNKIYCLDANSGTIIWHYTTGGRVLYSCPAIVDGKILVGSEDGRVYCLNATTGTHIWSYLTGSYVWSSPAVADGKVYVGSHDHKIYCLDASTGSHIWNFTTGNYVISSPAIAAGTVFIGSNDNKIYAFGPHTIHDIAITQVTSSKTVVCQGHSMHVNVTLENQGSYAGSFSVTAYYKFIVSIETKNIINLQSEEETTITFTWNTTGIAKGNYTLFAVAHTVPGETSINDNYLMESWVIVTMIGDITGPDGWPDGRCDMRDVGLIARYFGQEVPPAPANCDLTGPTTGVPDGEIDMRDIGLVARHFGETDP